MINDHFLQQLVRVCWCLEMTMFANIAIAAHLVRAVANLDGDTDFLEQAKVKVVNCVPLVRLQVVFESPHLVKSTLSSAGPRVV